MLVLLTHGPAGYDDLNRQLSELLEGEGWTLRGRGDLAGAVRHEIYELRRRLWALHLLGNERMLGAPLTLTETGTAAALTALRARALRPRHHMGVG